MTREEYIDFANALKNNYTIDFDKLPEFCDMAISALSTEGEYIKKSELLQHVTTEELSDYKDCDVIHAEEIDELTTYSFSDSAENKGKWEKIWRTDCECSEYVCSKCGNDIATKSDVWNDNFCSECGADMRHEPYKKGE